MRSALPLVVLSILTGCASSPTLVGGGEIRNDTDAEIHHVRAVHQPTQRTVFANRILPGRSLSLGFSPREMQAEYAELTWRTALGVNCSARLDAPACPPELKDQPTWVVYSIRADGTATVELMPAR